MESGDLIFVRGTGIISRIIQWVTKSKYSHVAIYYGEDHVVEAQGFRKVGFQALAYYAGQYDVVHVPLPQSVNGLQWLVKQIGRDYDYWDDVVLLIRCTFGIKVPWSEGQRIICSQLARDFLFASGVNIPDEDMTPEDLYEWTQGR